MTLCPSCGLQLSEGTEICPHHTFGPEDGWAESNRIWCDFFHRQVIPKRVEQVTLCPGCGSRMEDNFCQACYYSNLGGSSD